MKVAVFLICFPLFVWAQNSEWVTLGQTDVTEGYKTLYRLELSAPRGVHDIEDIRRGIQVMRFSLTWLPPQTELDEIKAHFQQMLANEFENPEDLKFNQIIINRLLKKLPNAKRHDVWHFEYSPDAGTAFKVGDKITHRIIGAETNEALHSAWLLSHPMNTSKLLKRLLKAQ